MNTSWQATKLANVLTPVSRAETVDPTKEYRLLGVRLEGCGPFLRETVLGSQSAATRLFKVEAGDFIYSRLFAWRGAFGVIQSALDGCYVSGEFPIFKSVADRIDTEFLRLWFQLPPTIKRVEANCTGSTPLTRNRFKENFFLDLEIPLPPLTEQRGIVARIESLSAKIEEASGFRQQAAQEINSLVKSEINAHFLAEQAKGTAFRNIGSFTSYDRYGPRFYNEAYSEDGIPILRATDIDEEGKINYKAMPKMSVAPQDIESFSLQRGDLAIVRSGSIGLSAVFDRPDFPCIPAAYLLQFRFNSSMNPYYVRHCLQCPLITDELKGRGTALKNVNASKIKSLLVPTPKLSEQRRIVTYFDGLQDKVDALKKLQSDTAAELVALLPSILDKAFKGKL